MDNGMYQTVATTQHCSLDSKKCEECKKWEEENWNNPAGAVRECDCQLDRNTGMGTRRHIILPTCQKCGCAPCGCTSEERYGYPVAPENDLQVQTIGNPTTGQKPKWAIEEDKKIYNEKLLNKISQAKTELTVISVLQKVFGWSK